MKAIGTTITPTFNKHAKAQEEADRHCVAAQAMIGAKEGVIEALTEMVRSYITDSILRTSDSDFKGVNKYTIHDVMQTAYENADCPPTTNVVEQLIEVLHYNFDFCKKVSANMEVV